MKKKYYYHFTGNKLRDGRPLPLVGKWLEHTGPLVVCESGLHASAHPFDALQYAPGNLLHLVELGGKQVYYGNPVDKVCARRRKIVRTIDAESLLRAFARRVALNVLYLWPDAPQVVREYLATGDEKLRAAARAAARAAREATWAATRAAQAATWAATREAAREATWAAAQAAPAATKKYRRWFNSMVKKEFAI